MHSKSGSTLIRVANPLFGVNGRLGGGRQSLATAIANWQSHRKSSVYVEAKTWSDRWSPLQGRAVLLLCAVCWGGLWLLNFREGWKGLDPCACC
jgi:hypothetical protein